MGTRKNTCKLNTKEYVQCTKWKYEIAVRVATFTTCKRTLTDTTPVKKKVGASTKSKKNLNSKWLPLNLDCALQNDKVLVAPGSCHERVFYILPCQPIVWEISKTANQIESKTSTGLNNNLYQCLEKIYSYKMHPAFYIHTFTRTCIANCRDQQVENVTWSCGGSQTLRKHCVSLP